MGIAIYRDILKPFERRFRRHMSECESASGARDEGERTSNGRIVVSHASYGPNRSPHRGPGMATSETPPGVRPLIAPMRWLLYAASALVFLAGFQLTVCSEQTATYFAWTIARPLTAAFLGASYWAAVPVEIIAARQSTWASARVAVTAIWLFTTLTLVTTLLHFDLFHFSSAVPSFFFNDTATTEIYTLSLHDALPISDSPHRLGIGIAVGRGVAVHHPHEPPVVGEDRKSTRLNSSHSQISYAVFCLKKKKCPSASPLQERGTRERERHTAESSSRMLLM